VDGALFVGVVVAVTVGDGVEQQKGHFLVAITPVGKIAGRNVSG
jgi:hypothetical protein